MVYWFWQWRKRTRWCFYDSRPPRRRYLINGYVNVGSVWRGKSRIQAKSVYYYHIYKYTNTHSLHHYREIEGKFGSGKPHICSFIYWFLIVDFFFVQILCGNGRRVSIYINEVTAYLPHTYIEHQLSLSLYFLVT